MSKNPIRLVEFVIGSFLALIALTNCFNVLSSSTTVTAPPAGDASRIEQSKPNQHPLSFKSPVGANSARSLFESNPGVELISPGSLATRASAVSRVASPFAPSISATKSHMLPPGDTQADPGDTLTYTVIITNSGSTDATGVNFSDTIDPNTTLVPGSVQASPVALDDSYHTIGNVNISVPVGQGVIANDLNPNGSGTLTVTQVNATGVPNGGSSTTSTANGSVTMSSDGSFSYTPNAAFRGPSDSFTYTLGNGTGKTDTATVTIAVNGLIWFVDSTAPSGGDGRLNSPFNCLVGSGCFDPVAADIPNDNIFVYTGAYMGGLTLLSGQKLIGQGAGDTLLNITGLPAPSGTNMLPSTGGTPPTIGAAGTNITLGSGNTIRGVTLSGSTAAAVDLSGTGFGTVTIAEVTLSGTGQALNLNNGTLSGPVASTAAFASISSDMSSTTGISLTSIAGNMSSGSTVITNPAGIGISVNTSSAALNFGSTISTLSGGAGVSLTTNTGAITFAEVNISPSANQKGLLATDNSNTITTSNGTISTSGAAAVEITRASGTTPLVISLTSVSANGSGTSGVVLTNTSGSFTVAGDAGSANNSSGGTIQSITNDGISLSNVQNISLDQMNIQSTGGSGVGGTLVTNFSFTNGTVSNSGNASFESNIAFNTNPTTANNINGTLTVTGSTLTNAFYSGLDVQSANGTVTNATVLNNIISNMTGGIGINFVGVGTASTAFNLNKATINTNTISNAAGGIQISIGNATTTGPGATAGIPNDATNILSITNNTVNGTTTQAIIAAVSGGNSATRSRSNFEISNNPLLTNTTGTTVLIGCNGYTTMTGTVANNVIVSNHTPNLLGANGIAGGNGVAGAGNAWTPNLTLTVTGNTISKTDGNGVLLVGRGTSGTFNLKLGNNSVAAPINDGGTARQGIRVDAGNAGSADDSVCLNISGNTSAGSNGATGIGVRKQGAIATTNDFGIQGIPQNPPSNTDVQNYIDAQNPNGGGTTIISGSNYVQCGTAPAAVDFLPESAALKSSMPKVGDTDDPSDSVNTRTVLRAHHGEASTRDNVQKISQQELNWMAQQAIQRWRAAGISVTDIARLEALSFELLDLASDELATIEGTRVEVDETAAGYGWYVDQMPDRDSEFEVPVFDKERQTTEFSPAFNRMDLLTVLMRELGAVYLQKTNRVPKELRWLMQPLLLPGVRRAPAFNVPERSTSRVSPGAGQSVNGHVASTAPSQPHTDSAYSLLELKPAIFNPSADLMPGSYGRSARRMSYGASAPRTASVNPAVFSGETVNLSIGTIPAGESVTIMFQVTINNPLPSGVCSVTNVGHVTGSNFSPVDTNTDVTTIPKPTTIGACPANIITNTAAGGCTAVVTYATPAGDGCPVPTVTCNPASGFAFPKGTTTVTCTATNGNPPDATCTFTVTVKDAEAPTCNLPANIVQNTDAGQCSAVVTYTATASDNCSGATIECTPASGSTFPKGTTTVNCIASDDSPDSPDTNCSFTVKINDNQPPTIGACPDPVMTNTDPGHCSAIVNYVTPSGDDNCPGVTVGCSPPPGFAFTKGTTTVTCTATDTSSNTASCSFTVTVVDNQPPSITCPGNINATDEGSGCATVNYTTPTPSDNCPGATASCEPPSGTCFAIGTTTVTCTAMDTSGNTASCQFTVTVTAAGLTALSPAKLWIGLKNSDDVGTKFDLLAEVLRNGTVVGSGQLNDVPGGSSGFNNAVLRTIALSLGSAVPMGPGDTMSFRLSVRIAATSGHNSGTVRLWYNGAAIDSGPGRDAGSRFDATIGGSTSDYFLRSPGFTLNTTAGSSRTSVDKLASRAGGNPWQVVGTWSKTF